MTTKRSTLDKFARRMVRYVVVRGLRQQPALKRVGPSYHRGRRAFRRAIAKIA